MKLKKAIKILDYHQQWRQGKTEVMFYTPKELTTALDEVLKAVKNVDVGSVVKSCDHDYPPEDGWNIHQPQHCSNCDKDL